LQEIAIQDLKSRFQEFEQLRQFSPFTI